MTGFLFLALIVFSITLCQHTVHTAFTVDSSVPFPRSPVEAKNRRCLYTRLHRMLAADCHNLVLEYLPSSLKSNTEVLDATFNRIREIYNDSFINYPDLKMLYLSDNMIHEIEAGAFDPVQDLEVLDLTKNSFGRVPEAIGSLPVLRKLMLEHNPLKEAVFSKPQPSVQFLSLSSCKLKSFPDFVALPGLVQLNMSNNQIKTIEVHEIAYMCRLKLLDLRGNPRLFRNDYCKCQFFSDWIRKRSIELFPDVSSICNGTKEGGTLINNPIDCYNNDTKLLEEESEMIYRSCETEVAEWQRPLRLKGSAVWALAAACFCAVLLVSFFSLYCIRKRQTRNRNRDTVDNSSERLTHEKENKS